MFQRAFVCGGLWLLALVSNAVAQPEADLRDRVSLWQERTFLCPSAEGGFPSKEEGHLSKTCDDGDSVMFNALLCRAGVASGCNAVRLSQDEDGRFWRSPNKRVQRPAEADGPKEGQTSFSGDHATGLMVYFGHTQDSEAFRKWIAWINSNERCASFCGSMPLGTPRYCKNDRCALRIGDCQTLLLLGARMKVGVPFCSPDPFNTVPTFASAAHALKKAYDDTFKKLPAQPPELKALRDNFNGALEAHEKAVAPIEALRTRIEAAAVQALSLAQIEKAISAPVNSRGYSRHNAMVMIMALQEWGVGSAGMSSEAVRIAADEPQNPFFQYVAHRRQSKASMLPLVLAECPSRKDPMNHRFQWAWERDTAEQAWLKTMYWDCLFAANLFLEDRAYPADVAAPAEAVLRQQLADLISKAQAAQKLAQELIEEIAGFAKVLEKPVDALKDAVQEKAKEVRENPAAILTPPAPPIPVPVPAPRSTIPLPTLKQPIPGMKI